MTTLHPKFRLSTLLWTVAACAIVQGEWRWKRTRDYDRAQAEFHQRLEKRFEARLSNARRTIKDLSEKVQRLGSKRRTPEIERDIKIWSGMLRSYTQMANEREQAARHHRAFKEDFRRKARFP
jgi:hypothetical protein